MRQKPGGCNGWLASPAFALTHRVFHLGRENVLGSMLIAKAHLMALNRWDNSDFDAY
jgi:hypothetical protein